LQHVDLLDDEWEPNLARLVQAINSILQAEIAERQASNTDRSHLDVQIESWTGEAIDVPQRPTCFAIMPISMPRGLLKKYDKDKKHFPNILEHLFRPAADRAGFEIIPTAVVDGDVVQAAIIRNLKLADLVLCDLSTWNANVPFELGIRVALDKPVAIVKDSRTDSVPFDVTGNSFHTYRWSFPGGLSKARLRDCLTTFRRRVSMSGIAFGSILVSTRLDKVSFGWIGGSPYQSSAVPDLPAGARTAPADRPHSVHQGRRAPRAATRGRGARPHQRETTPGLGGPGRLRHPHPTATDEGEPRRVE
jgi:hypothetical protein